MVVTMGETMGGMDTQLVVHLASLSMRLEMAVMVVTGEIGSALHTVVTGMNAHVHHVIHHIVAEMHFTFW
jgi:hypothetical protein